MEASEGVLQEVKEEMLPEMGGDAESDAQILPHHAMNSDPAYT